MSSSTPSPMSGGSSSEGSALRAFVDEAIAKDRQAEPVSPRSALLSQTSLQQKQSRAGAPSVSVSDHHSHSRVHGTVEKRSSRDVRKRSSRERRKRNTTSPTTELSLTSLSRLDLDRLTKKDPKAEALKLRELLEAAVRQVHVESKRAEELERANQETAVRFRVLNENRVAAQEEAAKANSELKLYQFQLDNAHKEIDRAKEAMQQIEKQRDEAEAAAARAREKARKLHQERMLAAAKEEGRRLGFDAGFSQAKQERAILAARRSQGTSSIAPSSGKGKQRESNSDASRRRRPSHARRHTEDDIVSSPELSPTLLPIRNLPSLALPLDPPTQKAGPSNGTPLRPFEPPPETEPDYESEDEQLTPPPQSSRTPRAKTPSVQVWPLEIPDQDQLDQSYNSHENPNESVQARPRDEWVTAGKHREIRGPPQVQPQTKQSQSTLRSQTPTQHPLSQPPQFPNGQPPPLLPSSRPRPPATRPDMTTPQKGVRFPTWARRPSLAKTKQQATSWYRSLSFRRKNKPDIDPIAEEPDNMTPTSAAGPAPLTGSTEPQTSSTIEPPDTGNNVYGPPAQPAQSWYQSKQPSIPASVRSQDYAHSRRRPISDASTRVSQFDLLSTPALTGGVPSRTPKTQGVKEKESLLSVIKEDPASRGNTPDRHIGASAAGPSGRVGSMASMQQPNFGQPHVVQQKTSYGTFNGSVNTKRRSRRPPSIAVPDYDAQLDPAGVAYAQQAPLGANGYQGYISNPSLNRKPSIEIDVVPPSGFAPDAAQSPPHTGRNHLSPYHVFRPAPSMQSFRSQGGTRMDPPPPPRPESAASRSMHGHSASGPTRYGDPSASPLQPPRPAFAYGTSGSESGSGRPESVRSHGSKRPPPRSASQSSFKIHNPDPPSSSGSGTPPQPRSRSGQRQHQGQGQAVLADVVAPMRGGAGLVLAPPMNRSKSNASMKSQGSYSKYNPEGYVDPAFWGVDGPGGPPAATPAQPRPGMDLQGNRLSRRTSVNSGLSYA